MKRAHVTEVRPVNEADQARCDRWGHERHAATDWIAFDSAGRSFVDASEDAARQACETYNHPKRARSA